jgi:molecular chaperone DnaJ
MPDDPYAVLGVDPTADLADIRRAYLAQLRASHPDLRPGDAAAEERTRDLNWAWTQVRARRGGVARRTPRPSRRPAPPRRQVYSEHQRAFRSAFTTATLRIALAMVALGLVLLAALAG